MSTRLEPREQRILILAARLEPSTADAESFAELARCLDERSWARIVDAAFFYRIPGLLRKHLKDKDLLGLLPPALANRLDRAYQAESVRALRKYSQLTRIVDAASSEGIDLILLKGAYLARWVYGDAALRPFNDFDLMCRPRDIKAMKRILGDMGYVQDVPVPHSRIHARFMNTTTQHLPHFEKPNWPNLELHTRPTRCHSSQAVDLDTLWARREAVEWDFGPVSALSTTDQLVHLLVHLTQHQSNGLVKLYWYADIHAIVREADWAVDWPHIIGESQKLAPALDFSPILQALRSGWSVPSPAGSISSRKIAATYTPPSPVFFPPSSAQHEAALRRAYLGILKQIRQIPSPAEKLLFLWRQIFPGRTYIRYRYSLPPNQNLLPIYLLHLWRGMRPFLRKIVPF